MVSMVVGVGCAAFLLAGHGRRWWLRRVPVALAAAVTLTIVVGVVVGRLWRPVSAGPRPAGRGWAPGRRGAGGVGGGPGGGGGVVGGSGARRCRGAAGLEQRGGWGEPFLRAVPHGAFRARVGPSRKVRPAAAGQTGRIYRFRAAWSVVGAGLASAGRHASRR